MNSLTNSSRSVLSRLVRLLLRRCKTAWSEVLDSVRALFSRHVKRTPPPPLPAASSRSRLPTPSRRWYCDPRKVAAAVLLPYAAVFAIAGAYSHKETVPYTNRVHRVILSPSTERELGDLAFEKVKKKLGDKIFGPSDPRTVRVRLIADDIIRGVHRTFPARSRSDGDSDTTLVTDDMWVNESRRRGDAAVQQPQTGHLGDLNWEVIVVKDDHVDAHSAAGGKIVVSTGLLDYFKTDAEIATLLAHEVGHVVARHSTEFTKITMLIPILYDLLPFSRRKEIEADLIGVMLLAAAGFDPRVAAGVYEKLGEIDRDSAWYDYIGSHPSCKKRSLLLSRGKVIEEALELYYKQVCAGEAVDRHFPYCGRFCETLAS